MHDGVPYLELIVGIEILQNTCIQHESVTDDIHTCPKYAFWLIELAINKQAGFSNPARAPASSHPCAQNDCRRHPRHENTLSVREYYSYLHQVVRDVAFPIKLTMRRMLQWRNETRYTLTKLTISNEVPISLSVHRNTGLPMMIPVKLLVNTGSRATKFASIGTYTPP
jgi:hypothetical protein